MKAQGNLASLKFEAEKSLRDHLIVLTTTISPSHETTRWREPQGNYHFEKQKGRLQAEEDKTNTENQIITNRLELIAKEDRRLTTKEFTPGLRVGEGGTCIDCYPGELNEAVKYNLDKAHLQTRVTQHERRMKQNMEMGSYIEQARSRYERKQLEEEYQKNKKNYDGLKTKKTPITALHVGLIGAAKKSVFKSTHTLPRLYYAVGELASPYSRKKPLNLDDDNDDLENPTESVEIQQNVSHKKQRPKSSIPTKSVEPQIGLPENSSFEVEQKKSRRPSTAPNKRPQSGNPTSSSEFNSNTLQPTNSNNISKAIPPKFSEKISEYYRKAKEHIAPYNLQKELVSLEEHLIHRNGAWNKSTLYSGVSGNGDIPKPKSFAIGSVNESDNVRYQTLETIDKNEQYLSDRCANILELKRYYEENNIPLPITTPAVTSSSGAVASFKQVNQMSSRPTSAVIKSRPQSANNLPAKMQNKANKEENTLEQNKKLKHSESQPISSTNMTPQGIQSENKHDRRMSTSQLTPQSTATTHVPLNHTTNFQGLGASDTTEQMHKPLTSSSSLKKLGSIRKNVSFSDHLLTGAESNHHEKGHSEHHENHHSTKVEHIHESEKHVHSKHHHIEETNVHHSVQDNRHESTKHHHNQEDHRRHSHTEVPHNESHKHHQHHSLSAHPHDHNNHHHAHHAGLSEKSQKHSTHQHNNNRHHTDDNGPLSMHHLGRELKESVHPKYVDDIEDDTFNQKVDMEVFYPQHHNHVHHVPFVQDVHDGHNHFHNPFLHPTAAASAITHAASHRPGHHDPALRHNTTTSSRIVKQVEEFVHEQILANTFVAHSRQSIAPGVSSKTAHASVSSTIPSMDPDVMIFDSNHPHHPHFRHHSHSHTDIMHYITGQSPHYRSSLLLADHRIPSHLRRHSYSFLDHVLTDEKILLVYFHFMSQFQLSVRCDRLLRTGISKVIKVEYDIQKENEDDGVDNDQSNKTVSSKRSSKNKSLATFSIEENELVILNEEKILEERDEPKSVFNMEQSSINEISGVNSVGEAEMEDEEVEVEEEEVDTFQPTDEAFNVVFYDIGYYLPSSRHMHASGPTPHASSERRNSMQGSNGTSNKSHGGRASVSFPDESYLSTTCGIMVVYYNAPPPPVLVHSPEHHPGHLSPTPSHLPGSSSRRSSFNGGHNNTSMKVDHQLKSPSKPLAHAHFTNQEACWKYFSLQELCVLYKKHCPERTTQHVDNISIQAAQAKESSGKKSASKFVGNKHNDYGDIGKLLYELKAFSYPYGKPIVDTTPHPESPHAKKNVPQKKEEELATTKNTTDVSQEVQKVDIVQKIEAQLESDEGKETAKNHETVEEKKSEEVPQEGSDKSTTSISPNNNIREGSNNPTPTKDIPPLVEQKDPSKSSVESSKTSTPEKVAPQDTTVSSSSLPVKDEIQEQKLSSDTTEKVQPEPTTENATSKKSSQQETKSTESHTAENRWVIIDQEEKQPIISPCILDMADTDTLNMLQEWLFQHIHLVRSTDPPHSLQIIIK